MSLSFPLELRQQNFTAGGKALVTLPLDSVIDRVKLKMVSSGGAISQASLESYIQNVKLRLNSKDFRDVSSEVLNEVNAFNGSDYAINDGYLDVDFKEMYRRTAAGEEATFLGTKGLKTAYIELDCASSMPADIVLTPTGWVSPANASTAQLKDIQADLISVSGTGEIDLAPYLSIPDNWDLQRLHIKEGGAGDIGKVEFKIDGVTVYEIDRGSNDDHLGRRGYVIPSDFFSIVFDHDAQLASRISKAAGARDQSFKVLATFDTNSGNPTLIKELIGNPNLA